MNSARTLAVSKLNYINTINLNVRVRICVVVIVNPVYKCLSLYFLKGKFYLSHLYFARRSLLQKFDILHSIANRLLITIFSVVWTNHKCPLCLFLLLLSLNITGSAGQSVFPQMRSKWLTYFRHVLQFLHTISIQGAYLSDS